MTLLDDPAFPRVARHLERLGAPSAALYKGPCFERRLASRLRARGRTRLADYAVLLDRDADERRRLLSAIAIGVTSFFRNPSTWRRLLTLLGTAPPRAAFRAWSAGCATGEEAYTIAMILARVSGPAGGPPLGDWTVTGTDIDEASLAVARAGRYPLRAVREVEAFARAVGDVQDGQFSVGDRLRSRVTFRREDVTAPSSRGTFDLVVCRNVLIYFGPEGQARAMRALIDALAPGGLLVLGRAEMAGRDTEPALELVDTRERVYRRRP